MPSLETIGLFCAAALVLIVAPGPSVMFIVARSIQHGRRAGLVSVAATQLGICVHVAAAALGISAVLASSATAFSIVKYVGAAYLILLGVRTLLRRGEEGFDVTVPSSNRRIFRQALAVAILNPKTGLFFLAFFPQFVRPDAGPAALQMTILGAIFVGIATISDGAYAMLAGSLGNRLRTGGRFERLRKTGSGTAYIALGVTAALAGNRR